MLHTRCKTPPTATPTIRNGSSKSQTIGYSTSAISASGHEIKNSRHHRRNVNMMLVSLFFYETPGGMFRLCQGSWRYYHVLFRGEHVCC